MDAVRPKNSVANIYMEVVGSPTFTSLISGNTSSYSIGPTEIQKGFSCGVLYIRFSCLPWTPSGFYCAKTLLSAPQSRTQKTRARHAGGCPTSRQPFGPWYVPTVGATLVYFIFQNVDTMHKEEKKTDRHARTYAQFHIQQALVLDFRVHRYCTIHTLQRPTATHTVNRSR